MMGRARRIARGSGGVAEECTAAVESIVQSTGSHPSPTIVPPSGGLPVKKFVEMKIHWRRLGATFNMARQPRLQMILLLTLLGGGLPCDSLQPRVVIVPGFLYGARNYEGLCGRLRAAGLDAVIAPIAAWHWLVLV